MPRARVFAERIQPESSPAQVADGLARLFASFDLPGLFGGKSVLVKPNLCGEQPEANTDPRVIYGVVRALEPYAARIVVGDGSIVGVDTASVIEGLGLSDLLRNTRAELVDLKAGRYVETDLPNGSVVRRVALAEEAARADAVISLAKLKVHDATGVSLSIKNLKGILHEYDNLHFHHMNLCECLVDLVAAIKPRLSVVDGIYGFDTHGAGQVGLGVLIAGEDPVAVDAVAARSIGVDPTDIYSGTLNESHIKMASERGVGEIDDIEVIGSLPKASFTPPPENLSHIHVPDGIEIIDGNPCGACIGMLGSVLQKLDPAVAKGKKTTILVGPNAPPPDKQIPGRTIIIGSCLHRLQSESEGSTFVIGCPPNGTYDVLPILEA